MSGYQRPCDAPVSSSWADHKNRNPPSSEPGTDYACAHGTPLLAAGDGVISDAKTTNGSATGRYITISLDDGRTVRYLHLSGLLKAVGDRVSRGDVIAYSGGSANGSDWGVGAHVHTTLWPGVIWAAPTIDFDAHVGTDPDIPPFDMEDEMIRIQATNRGIALIGPGYFRGLTSDEEVQNSDVLISKHVTGNDRQFDLWVSMAFQGQSSPTPAPPAQHELTAPAWTAVAALLVLAVVGVIDLVLSVVPG